MSLDMTTGHTRQLTLLVNREEHGGNSQVRPGSVAEDSDTAGCLHRPASAAVDSVRGASEPDSDAEDSDTAGWSCLHPALDGPRHSVPGKVAFPCSAGCLAAVGCSVMLPTA